MELLKPNFDKEYREAWDKKEPSPLVEAGIEQQACLGLYRFHEAALIPYLYTAVTIQFCHHYHQCQNIG